MVERNTSKQDLKFKGIVLMFVSKIFVLDPSSQLTCMQWGICDGIYPTIELTAEVTDIIIMPTKRIMIS